jgi:hypothetical protein
MQKWLPSLKSISTTLLRQPPISGVSLRTTIPSAAGWVQAACGRPLTITVQTRQAPAGVTPFRKHRRGM